MDGSPKLDIVAEVRPKKLFAGPENSPVEEAIVKEPDNGVAEASIIFDPRSGLGLGEKGALDLKN
jgi:hypothetical protein